MIEGKDIPDVKDLVLHYSNFMMATLVLQAKPEAAVAEQLKKDIVTHGRLLLAAQRQTGVFMYQDLRALVHYLTGHAVDQDINAPTNH